MFEKLGLGDNLLKALDALGLEKPTEIQEVLIPLISSGRDVQACARTGSGKSAAFLCPLLQRMLDKPEPDKATRCLVISPTRELAQQLDKHCRDLAKFTPISSITILGGEGFKEQQARLRKNPEIVIGTPGRLLEHVERNSLLLDDLEFLVLDEADRSLDMGLQDDVTSIVAACNPQRQTLLLSATLKHKGLEEITNRIQKNPERVTLESHRQPHENIEQQVILADDPGHKQQLCNWLLSNESFEKALVFTNTRVHSEELAVFLIQQGLRVACLHGEMLQDERKQVMRLFRDGKVKILVATDLAARGLDVPEVNLVINFALARSGSDYVHRIGRTGRAGQSGVAISLISPQEWNLMESIQRYLNLDFIQRKIDGLPARFSGPSKKSAKKNKSRKGDAGKAKGKKERKDKKGAVKDKAKQRHRNKKSVGKRRQPRAPATSSEQTANQDQAGAAGLAPLKRAVKSTAKKEKGS